jgi:aminoglycoside phosphotransferase (APT) family kinase protein
MNADLNGAALIRAGEELPLGRLAEYLKRHLPASEATLTVEQFPDGHSNLTYLLHLGASELVLRRPPFGNVVASAHDMGREFRILSRLNAVYPAAPRPELYCDDETVIGSSFYVMERRHGLILRKTLPAGMTIGPDLARRTSCALIDNLAALHAIDYRQAGLSDMGKPVGYVLRQVTGWTKRYNQAQTSVVPAMDRVADWLNQNLPAESGAAIIHNDYKYDNVMLDRDDPTKIVAVLDWEMATIGDPLMDLGTSLGYWVEASDPEPLRLAAFGPTALPGSLTRREIVEHYQERTAVAVPNAQFYYCFGLFKLAVIVQQIFARFVRGNTADPRFAHLDRLVTLLGEQADRTLNGAKV